MARTPTSPPGGVRSITTKQRAFIEEYLGNGRKGADAYRKTYNPNATPKRATEEASKLLRNSKVAPILAAADAKADAATAKVLDRYALDKESTIRRLAFLACSDSRDLFSWTAKGVKLKPSAELSDEAAFAITEIAEMEGGRLRVKLADKRAALMDIAKLRGWVTDQHQQLGPDGKPIAAGAIYVLQVS